MQGEAIEAVKNHPSCRSMVWALVQFWCLGSTQEPAFRQYFWLSGTICWKSTLNNLDQIVLLNQTFYSMIVLYVVSSSIAGWSIWGVFRSWATSFSDLSCCVINAKAYSITYSHLAVSLKSLTNDWIENDAPSPLMPSDLLLLYPA